MEILKILTKGPTYHLQCTALRITYLLISSFIGGEVMPFIGPTKKE